MNKTKPLLGLPCATVTRKPLWLYRVLETDDGGDPLDHGAARADTHDELIGYLSEHLTEIVGESVELTVRVYPTYDVRRGVMRSVNMYDTKILTRSVVVSP